MAWTPPNAPATGFLVTAAYWLAQITNNLLVLKVSVDDNGHLIDATIVSKSANYTVVGTDDLIVCTANSFTITLLTAVGRAGKRFTVKNIGTGTITMASTSSQTIDGAAAGTWFAFAGDSLTFESDGANWVVV